MTSNGEKQVSFPARILRGPRSFFGRNTTSDEDEKEDIGESDEERQRRPTRWSMGVLNDSKTHEVPGSVLLLSDKNQPLGLRHAPARASASSLPPQPVLTPVTSRRGSRASAFQEKKTTPDGAIILEPQPEDTNNDPLNWPKWRRDAALLSLGLYCMVGGGMTPILAAGFTNVATTYAVAVPKVALTTGLYMMGLGVGSIFASPTAILYGKRPVYLGSALLFIASAVWCAVSPSYHSLLVARIFQGISVSSVECLPSATIAEIFFLHERAYRIGIYTLLLLGGKNLVPLVSAVIIQSLGWRWVFWVVAMVVGFCGILLFLFVPESFWDRTPRAKIRKGTRNTSKLSLFSSKKSVPPNSSRASQSQPGGSKEDNELESVTSKSTAASAPQRPPIVTRLSRGARVGFVSPLPDISERDLEKQASSELENTGDNAEPIVTSAVDSSETPRPELVEAVQERASQPVERKESYSEPPYLDTTGGAPSQLHPHLLSERYTNVLRHGPPLTFVQQMKPYSGRLTDERWLNVAFRPFILFAYPAVLWSAGVYACAVGWLIVLSESVAVVYRSKDTYNFSALSTGLIYLSPFIGGILGTAVAGKLSDVVVRAMSKRNGGLYEPEFRLVMAAPVTITTVIGLMGFGWSAQVHDSWIVPTIFFGIISFGCSLASTTAITFCVDSYRQYAGEALVTLNISKNIFHGLVFSLFFNNWLEADGSRTVFIWLGVIQLVLMASTIPLYIFGKRARMWTVRLNLMEKF
ncbi:major facilitator superfamily domain-containing protein [Halenospora varia]|nr:major facilitator superfamily domain-containing protein [Halenospora varia]